MVSSLSRRPFDFGANHLALDFVNTVSGRPIYTRDDLADPSDLVDWAASAGLLNHVEQVKRCEEEPVPFNAAVALRENLYRVFDPIARGEVPPAAALAFVNRRAAQALRSAQWVRGEAGFEPRWQHNSIESICGRLADEAIALLRSPAVSRVGSCAGCGWLFLDTSRAHARRWCSMNACGVRDKMRRYHQRLATVTSVT
jgi:predicted RNA-binding Zn ribbon-like protein